ncbi:BRO1-like domain-containing protein [Syncephalis fuscata]|nr:BRO1-like domain-containing protein [Syncephalis fuscata]
MNVLGRFLSIPLKQGQANSLASKLKQYVIENKSGELNDLHTLDTLRDQCIHLRVESSSIDCLQNYQAQLVFALTKFPNNIDLSCCWSNAFGPKENIANQSTLAYERASVLFNLAAVYAGLGAQEDLTDQEAIRRACQYFQHAAGLFELVYKSMEANILSSALVDFSEPVLRTLIHIMLAQAQECFYIRSVLNNSKNTIVIKLAMASADLYEDVEKQVRAHSLHNIVGKNATISINNKYRFYRAMAYQRMSIEHYNTNEHGNRVACLQYAIGLLNGIAQISNLDPDISELKDKLDKEIVLAEKDNDMVYLQPVPATNDITLPASAVMVAAQLPPKVAHPTIAHSLYQKRRDILINNPVENILQQWPLKKKRLLEETNADGLLEAAKQTIGLPPSLLTGANEIRQQGGMALLDQLYEKLAKLNEANQQLIQQHDVATQKQMNQWRNYIETLGQDVAELEKKIPDYKKALTTQEQEQLIELRATMYQSAVTTAIKQVDTLSDLRVNRLSSFEACIDAQLTQYQPLLLMICQFGDEQTEWLQKIKIQCNTFRQSRQENLLIKSRETVLRDYSMAYTAFMEIHTNIIEGIEPSLVKYEVDVASKKDNKAELPAIWQPGMPLYYSDDSSTTSNTKPIIKKDKKSVVPSAWNPNQPLIFEE